MKIGYFKKVLVVGIIFLFIGIAVAHENVSIKHSQPSLEVTVDVSGSKRIFDITTYISNIGDEQVTIMITTIPGGGFEIRYNEEGIVYEAPFFFFPDVWDLTLNPGQIQEIYNETWKGVDISGNKLPSGNYSVRGFVNTGNGDFFSEFVDIYLEKAKSKNILSFLERYQMLERFLFL
jgi:hypothetical protein